MSECKIQEALFHHVMCKRHVVAIPNTYLYANESDMLSIPKSGYVYEFEIKISRADFKADFKKPRHELYLNKDYNKGPALFWYVVPYGLITVDEIPPYAGLIYCSSESYVQEIKKPERFKKSQKLTAEQILKLCGNLSFRYWMLKRELQRRTK